MFNKLLHCYLFGHLTDILFQFPSNHFHAGMIVIFLSFLTFVVIINRFSTPQKFDKNKIFKQMSQIGEKTKTNPANKSIVNEIRFFRI